MNVTVPSPLSTTVPLVGFDTAVTESSALVLSTSVSLRLQVGLRERLRRVLVGRRRVVDRHRRVVDRRHRDRHRVRRRIQVHSAIGRPAVVLHLEREGRIRSADSFASGANFRLPAVMSATRMLWPAVTSTPFSCTFPLVASVVIVTAAKSFAGVSFGSVNPNSRRRERVRQCPRWS